MIGENWPIIGDFLGIGADNLALWQMVLRALLVYPAAIVLVRLGRKRFLGEYAALDAILGFMLGSILSSALTGSTPFFETILGAALTLVLVHWLFAAISFYSDRFGTLVKGNRRELVSDGEIDWDAMQQSNLSEDDLMAAVRREANVADVSKVQQAILERSGNISVLTRKREPRIVDIQVAEGVQTVRVEIG